MTGTHGKEVFSLDRKRSSLIAGTILALSLTACVSSEDPLGEVNQLNPETGSFELPETNTMDPLNPNIANGGTPADGMSITTMGQGDSLAVASWDLMRLHGQYHASQKGKVYSFGTTDPTEFWHDAKSSLQEAERDLKDAMEQFSY